MVVRIWSCIGSIFHNFLNSHYFITCTWHWVERSVVIYIHLEFIGLKKQQVLFFSFWWSVSICHLFSIVFQKCWHHGCVHAPSWCQMSTDFFAFRGCENRAWSTHCKYNFFIDLCKKSSLKNFCASWRCLVIEQLLRIAHLVLSKQFSSTSNDEQKLTWIAFDFQFFYRKFVSLYLLSVARMVDCTTDCTCVFMI